MIWTVAFRYVDNHLLNTSSANPIYERRNRQVENCHTDNKQVGHFLIFFLTETL